MNSFRHFTGIWSQWTAQFVHYILIILFFTIFIYFFSHLAFRLIFANVKRIVVYFYNRVHLLQFPVLCFFSPFFSLHESIHSLFSFSLKSATNNNKDRKVNLMSTIRCFNLWCIEKIKIKISFRFEDCTMRKFASLSSTAFKFNRYAVCKWNYVRAKMLCVCIQYTSYM